MQLSHRAALGGTQLDAVDSLIMVKGVSTLAPKEREITAQTGGSGLRFVEKTRDSLEVQVRIGLRLFDDDMDDREELLEKVNAWASALPAWFTTTQKPDRRLYVESVQLPAAGDPYEWTNEYTYTFTAYEDPYWQNDTATTKALTQGNTGSDSITVPGSAESFADVTVQNKSGDTLNGITISINGNEMTFADLGLANNGTLTIDHVIANGVMVLRAKIGNTSVLANRTGADDFITKPGNNAISYSADGSAIVTVSVKGRYL